MHQVKFFKGIESEITELQNQINDWLKSEGVKVVNIFGNIAPQTIRAGAGGERQFPPSDVFIAVVYEST